MISRRNRPGEQTVSQLRYRLSLQEDFAQFIDTEANGTSGKQGKLSPGETPRLSPKPLLKSAQKTLSGQHSPEGEHEDNLGIDSRRDPTDSRPFRKRNNPARR
jgi:hypothetical protein